MAYASLSGRARTSASNPQAHAICDRCGFRYNWVNLRWQYDWRGATMQNIKILVCKDCYDKPQEQLRAIVVPADPTPIVNARVQDFVNASTDYLAVSTSAKDPITGIPLAPTTLLVTGSDPATGQNLTTQPIGIPTGLDPNAVMPLYEQTQYRVPIPFISVIANNTPVITVTCSSIPPLSVNSQIAVYNLNDTRATGIYSVTAVTGTVFQYQVSQPVTSGSLADSGTQMFTALVNLPYEYEQIPLTGAGSASLSAPEGAILLEDGSGYLITEDGLGYLEI